MAAGRPRTVAPPPEELEALGMEMVDWVKANNPLHLSAWYSIEKMFSENVWDTIKRRPEFITYYEIALKIVGQKYLDKTSNVREGISHRWQRVYFKDVKMEEDETEVFKSNLKKEEITHGAQLADLAKNPQELSQK